MTSEWDFQTQTGLQKKGGGWKRWGVLTKGKLMKGYCSCLFPLSSLLSCSSQQDDILVLGAPKASLMAEGQISLPFAQTAVLAAFYKAIAYKRILLEN